MAMNEEKMSELLIEIKSKLDYLADSFEKVSNGVGFPRCVEREQRIIRLEQDVIAMKQQVKLIDTLMLTIGILEKGAKEAKDKKERFDAWLMRTTWMVVIAGVVKLAFFN